MNAKKKRSCFGDLISIFIIPLMIFATIWGCVTASSKIEEIIRSDEELSRLDKTLNNSYLQALNRTDIKEKIIESQSLWLKNERNVCQNVECIKRAYDNRIKELGFTSSYGIVFFRDPNSNTSPQEQIRFGAPVQPAEQEELKNILQLSSSQPPRELATNAEVILISGYEPSNRNKGGTIVKVEVNRPGSKVLLILTSYETINWQVSASPSTIISGIVTSEYKTPTVTTSISTHGYLVKLPYAYETENVNFTKLLNILYSMFGINKVDVFRGSYAIPSVVKISTLDPPRAELTKDGPSPQNPNKNFTFSLIKTDYNEAVWSLTGPVKDDDASYIGEGKIAISKRDRIFFKLRGDKLEFIDQSKSTSGILHLPPNFPIFSWAMDIAYDAKRDIVSVVTLGGEGFLYRLDASRKLWIDFRSLNNVDIYSLCYDQSSDRYIAWTNHGSLIFISGEGNALFKRNIRDRLAGFGRLYDRGNGPSPRITIVPHGNDIALLYIFGKSVKKIWYYNVEEDTVVLTYQK